MYFVLLDGVLTSRHLLQDVSFSAVSNRITFPTGNPYQPLRPNDIWRQRHFFRINFWVSVLYDDAPFIFNELETQWQNLRALQSLPGADSTFRLV